MKIIVKYIYVICAKDKNSITTIIEELQALYGLRATKTHTTRPKKYQREGGYVFTSEEFFKENIYVASANINSHKYGISKEEIETCDIFPCEAELAIEFSKKYIGKKLVKIIYVWDWNCGIDLNGIDYEFAPLDGIADIVVCCNNHLCADRIHDFICENEGTNRGIF